VAREPRIEIAGGIYHLFARGNERREIFLDDDDRIAFMETLATTRRRYAFQVLAYCLMDTHYHAVVRTLEPNLSDGMQYLGSVYAQRFNRRHGRVGHLFQGRFRSVLVQNGGHLLNEIRYVTRNRLRAGLCSSLDAWPWCSHAAILGHVPGGVVDRAAVLELFHEDPDRAIAGYRELVGGGTDERRQEPYPLVIGDAAYVRSHLTLIEPSREYPQRLVSPPRSTLAALLPRYPSVGELATAHAAGYSLSAIADHLGLNKSTIARRLRKRATIQI
jgi:REP element-mobilizing transposase RayT